MTDDKTATHEQVRKEFEKITLVPDDVEFSAEYLAYVWINFPAVTAPFNDMWASFYDGWQAAKERYGAREAELESQLVKVRDLLGTLPEDALGTGTATDCAPWSIRDEVIYGITHLLATKEQKHEQ